MCNGIWQHSSSHLSEVSSASSRPCIEQASASIAIARPHLRQCWRQCLQSLQCSAWDLKKPKDTNQCVTDARRISKDKSARFPRRDTGHRTPCCFKRVLFSFPLCTRGREETTNFGSTNVDALWSSDRANLVLTGRCVHCCRRLPNTAVGKSAWKDMKIQILTF